MFLKLHLDAKRQQIHRSDYYVVYIHVLYVVYKYGVSMRLICPFTHVHDVHDFPNSVC